MKYQAIKHNKTTPPRLLKMSDTLHDAMREISMHTNDYRGRSYIGQFPTYVDEKGKTYSIQGSVPVGGSSVVCSIPDAELTAHGI